MLFAERFSFSPDCVRSISRSRSSSATAAITRSVIGISRRGAVPPSGSQLKRGHAQTHVQFLFLTTATLTDEHCRASAGRLRQALQFYTRVRPFTPIHGRALKDSMRSLPFFIAF
jgi:hypothetical protein